MSWSFTVPAVPAAQFEQAANAAKSTYEDNLAGQDYALAQLASGQADEAIKAAVAILNSGVIGDGNVSASLSGHAVTAGDSPSSQSVNVSLSCSPVQPADPAPVEQPATEPAAPPPVTEPAPTEPAPTEPAPATDAAAPADTASTDTATQ